MLKHYFKTALRNIFKQKYYSLINVIGLSVGISCIALAFLYTQYEFSFDDFYKNANRIYRVVGKDSDVMTPALLAPTALERFPEVSSATRLLFGSYDNNRVLFHYRDKSLYSRGYYADEHFFEIFSYPLVKGDVQKALVEPGCIVITKSFAKKYFGNEDPMGEFINFDKKSDLKVTGVMENVPSNSHLQFEFLISFATYANSTSGQSFVPCWPCSGFMTYFKLRDKVSVSPLQSKLSDLMKEKTGDAYTYFLQPIKDIRLFSRAKYEPVTLNVSDISYIYLALSIALVILLLGCINYINIMTSRTALRSNEIGIRKLVGAGKKQIVFQYFTESLLITVFSTLLSLMLIELAVPFVNSYANLHIEIEYWKNPVFLLFLGLMCAVVSLIAGAYPALVFSSIKPLKIVSKLSLSSRGGVRLRRMLVIVQFAAAICLLVITLIIESQLNYVNNQDVGYDKRDIVVVKLKGENFEHNRQNIKNEILRHSKIISVSYSDNLPCAIKSSVISRVTSNGDSTRRVIHFGEVDNNFTDVYNIEVVDGRNFPDKLQVGSRQQVLVNESAAELLGDENPVGKNFSLVGNRETEIVGVVKDFNFLSLHKGIAPLVLMRGEGSFLSVKIQSGGKKAALEHIENVVKRFVPDYPFEYSMFVDYFQREYASENNLRTAFRIFAVIAVLIGCLGLMGLSSFSAVQKSKEIAIRKVLGASISDIVQMLSGEFVVLVVIANIIAWPVAYYTMNRWLQQFVYRVDIGLPIFLLAGLVAVLIALFTVSFHSLRAALEDSIKGIRNE